MNPEYGGLHIRPGDMLSDEAREKNREQSPPREAVSGFGPGEVPYPKDVNPILKNFDRFNAGENYEVTNVYPPGKDGARPTYELRFLDDDGKPVENWRDKIQVVPEDELKQLLEAENKANQKKGANNLDSNQTPNLVPSASETEDAQVGSKKRQSLDRTSESENTQSQTEVYDIELSGRMNRAIERGDYLRRARIEFIQQLPQASLGTLKGHIETAGFNIEEYNQIPEEWQRAIKETKASYSLRRAQSRLAPPIDELDRGLLALTELMRRITGKDIPFYVRDRATFTKKTITTKEGNKIEFTGEEDFADQEEEKRELKEQGITISGDGWFVLLPETAQKESKNRSSVTIVSQEMKDEPSSEEEDNNVRTKETSNQEDKKPSEPFLEKVDKKIAKEWLEKLNDILRRRHSEPFNPKEKFGEWVIKTLRFLRFRFETEKVTDDLLKINNMERI